MVCAQCDPPALPHPGAGPAAGHSANAVVLPARALYSKHSDGGRPALRAGTDGGECVPFLAQGPLQFSACGLDGIWEPGTPWFDWTYGTYLLVLVGLLLALSLGCAGLTVFLSQYSGNYIAMLLKAVPLFVAVGAMFGSWLLDQPFTFRPLWDGYGPWVPKGSEAAAAAVLLFLGLGPCALSCRRQARRELL